MVACRATELGDRAAAAAGALGDVCSAPSTPVVPLPSPPSACPLGWALGGAGLLTLEAVDVALDVALEVVLVVQGVLRAAPGSTASATSP